MAKKPKMLHPEDALISMLSDFDTLAEAAKVLGFPDGKVRQWRRVPVSALVKVSEVTGYTVLFLRSDLMGLWELMDTLPVPLECKPLHMDLKTNVPLSADTLATAKANLQYEGLTPAQRRRIVFRLMGGVVSTAKYLNLSRSAAHKWRTVPVKHLEAIYHRIGVSPHIVRPDLLCLLATALKQVRAEKEAK